MQQRHRAGGYAVYRCVINYDRGKYCRPRYAATIAISKAHTVSHAVEMDSRLTKLDPFRMVYD